MQGTLFAGGAVPAAYLAARLPESRALIANGYYVDQDSDERAGTPSLRRKQLDVAGGAPTITDLQIVPGVEDLQVELGARLQRATRMPTISCSRTPPFPPATRSSRSAVWLLVRAEQQETGFIDGRSYSYAQPRRLTRLRMRSGGFSSARRSRSGTHGDEGHDTANRQQGAALVIGLILLVVLTILAVSGVFTSTMELRMVRNTQSQERAFQAAEVAIEDALANPVISTSAGFNPGDRSPSQFGRAISSRTRWQPVGQCAPRDRHDRLQLRRTFQTYHFQVAATGNRSRQRRCPTSPRVFTSSALARDDLCD